jgi:hypothetical protein
MSSADTLVQEGIRLAAMGGHAEARGLLFKAVAKDSRNESARLRLTELAEEDGESIQGLGCI